MAIQHGITPASRQQLRVRPTLNDFTILHDQNSVSVFDGAEPVRNNKRGAPFHGDVKSLLNIALGLGIQGRSGFIENQYRRILK